MLKVGELRNAKGLETNYKTRGHTDELKLLKININK
jgi:hypothetical protein